MINNIINQLNSLSENEIMGCEIMGSDRLDLLGIIQKAKLGQVHLTDGDNVRQRFYLFQNMLIGR